MAFSIGLPLYLTASRFIGPFAQRILRRRLAAGKEAPDRITERSGIASAQRPEGPLIWFHAASVGEALSVLDLIETLNDAHPDLNVLMTTGTKTSAEVIGSRLPGNMIHQFAPLDVRSYVRKFLSHWRPDVAVWTESELWPALIIETSRIGAPMIMVNARISTRSFGKWRRFKGSAKTLLGCFDHILAQDASSAEHIRQLGAPPARVEMTGSLKESAGALPCNETERNDIVAQLETRPVWLAASTHEGEEMIAADAHRMVRQAVPRALLIIAPRHPERGPDIATTLKEAGWAVSLRSDGGQPDLKSDIYVADTLGEMGLWYRIAPVSFVGGSLTKIGGHNPFEPAALGSAIIHGPHIENAAEIYERLGDAKATRQVRNATELGRTVIKLQEPQIPAQMAHAAWEISTSGAGAAARAAEVLNAALSKARDD